MGGWHARKGHCHEAEHIRFCALYVTAPGPGRRVRTLEPDFPTSAAATMQTWPNLGYSKASKGDCSAAAVLAYQDNAARASGLQFVGPGRFLGDWRLVFGKTPGIPPDFLTVDFSVEVRNGF